jgi:predicted ATPase
VNRPAIQRLALRNYKSIADCSIELGPVTILVGRNGAGKSNILDALRFTSDALLNNLEFSMRARGGINGVRRRSLGSRPNNFAIEMLLSIPNGDARYVFKIAAAPGQRFVVAEESCECRPSNGAAPSSYTIQRGRVTHWSVPGSRETSFASAEDRLYLVAVSALPQFRPVYDTLTRMAFHNLNPEEMKRPQNPESGERLARDGHNLASVIKLMGSEHPERMVRVIQYLNGIGVPIKRVAHKQAGTYETIEIAQEVSTSKGRKSWPFDASAMSDGTVRALAMLVSLLSAGGDAGRRGATLVGIEEPETALHPAAAGALVDALLEASEETQIMLTCHSPDMLDHDGVSPEMIRVVISENGVTKVGPLSTEKKDLLKKHLSTAGELHRLDQLTPDPEDLRRQQERHGTLWESSV